MFAKPHPNVLARREAAAREAAQAALRVRHANGAAIARVAAARARRNEALAASHEALGSHAMARALRAL